MDQHADPVDNVDWSTFSFGLNGVETDYMWCDTVVSDGKAFAPFRATNDCLVPMGKLQLSPAATVLNYGQGLFEGLKAVRRKDGSISIFRPELNADRMSSGAERFFLPVVPPNVFLTAVDAVVRANAKWVPPFSCGALYLRPLLMGTGAALGVKPSMEATFCIYASPVGNYFKGDLKAIQLQAVKGYSRAAPGGSGAVKAIGNYASAFRAQYTVKQNGFDEVLCLDALTGEAIEEAGASNFFAVFSNKTIVTPGLETETILPGVTRRSIMDIAKNECGFEIVEGRLTLSDLANASEAFCCGTGACITPVGYVSILDRQADGTDKESSVIVFGDGGTGKITRQLYKLLTEIQNGNDDRLSEKYKEWLHIVKP
ncbi:hypothetical protein MPSEU_000896600 [Mayamaea pseudoterrestris]|nr:hypothetical protein MPSEU_000896600 [Mayamaea pseudoterrestris]